MAGNLVGSPPTGWTLDWHQLTGTAGGWSASGGVLTHTGTSTSGCASDAFAVTPGELLFVSSLGAGSIAAGARFRVAYGTSSTFSAAATTSTQDIVTGASFSASGNTWDGFVTVPSAVTHARLVVYALSAGSCTWSNVSARRLSTLTAPTIKVEISFGRASNYAANGVLTWIVGTPNSDNQVNSSFLSPRGGSTPDVTVWSDVTAAVEAVSITRGRRSALDAYDGGSCSVTLDNTSRDFDPLNVNASADWALNGVSYVGTGRPLRVSIVDSDTGESNPIFTGRTTSWTPSWDGFRGRATVQAAESLAELDIAIDAVNAVDISSQRTDLMLGALLDAVGWPSALRRLDTGTVVAPDVSLGGNLLPFMRLLATTERGGFYTDGGGRVRFRVASSWRSANVQATIDPSSTVGAFGLDYEQAALAFDNDTLRNQVLGTRIYGATTQVASDIDSITSFGTRSYSVKDLFFGTDAETLTWANSVLAANKSPIARVDSIEIWPDVNPSWWGLLMWADFGDRFVVKVEPPPAGSDVITQTVQLEAVTWDIKPLSEGGVRCKWSFVPV